VRWPWQPQAQVLSAHGQTFSGQEQLQVVQLSLFMIVSSFVSFSALSICAFNDADVRLSKTLQLKDESFRRRCFAAGQRPS
jgi:hypothetical protein